MNLRTDNFSDLHTYVDENSPETLRGKCTISKCNAKNEGLLLPTNNTASEEDIWIVKGLPTDWVPDTSHSEVVEKLMVKREIEHQNALNTITSMKAEVNLDIEIKIRLQSEQFKHDVNCLEDQIQNRLKTIDLDPDGMLTLKKEDFINATNDILELKENYNPKLEEFYAFIQDLEKSRIARIKDILKSAYTDLHKISFKSPFELQKYFEKEVLDVNEMLLNNLRTYEELNLKMKLRSENDQRLHLQTMYGQKEYWCEIRKANAIKKLNELRNSNRACESAMLQFDETQKENKVFLENYQNMQDMLSSMQMLPVRKNNVLEWLKNIQQTIRSLDSSAIKLIELYRSAVIKVFGGCLDDLQNLADDMMELGISEPSECHIDEFVCAFDELSREYNSTIENIQDVWESVIAELQEQLKSAFQYFSEAAHIWDAHFERIHLAQEIVSKDIKKTTEKNYLNVQNLDIQLVISIDTLRQASTEEELDNELRVTNNLLDLLKKTFVSHHYAEVKVVEKYRALVAKETEILIREITLFLDTHNRDPGNVAPKVSNILPLYQYAVAAFEPTIKPSHGEEVDGLLPQKIRNCRYAVKAVHNWIFGLWEAIKEYKIACKEESEEEAEKWIHSNEKMLLKALNFKLAFNSSRFQRLKFNVYDIRKSELKSHADRLERHKAGTENEMENVRQSYTIFEQQCQQMLEEYNNKYTTITAKLIRAKNSTVIKAWFAEFNYHTEMTHKQFDKLQEEQENKLAKTVNNIKRSTYEFANHVRLFSEDGCFASEQTKLFMKELKVVSKVSNKKYGSVEQEARRAFAISMDQFEELVNKFSKMFTTGLEETEFYEKSVKVLKSLQGLIREQVLNMKSLTNRLNRALKAIIVKEYQHVGDPACLDKYENLVDTVLQAGILLIESLLQLDPIINVRRIDFDALPVECFKECLFELAPVHQTSFVSKISHALYTTLEEIEELAKDFYDEHETIINTKRLQPTFNEFMTEMLAKYCYYHLQVEMLWLDQTNAFLKCIPKLHNSMTNFQNQFINQHHKYYSDQMASLQQDVINQTTKINETNIITLDGIYKKLKPLHGYVKNKELLEELQNEMVEACEQIRSNPVVEMLQEHREMLDRNAAFYRSDVNSVAKNLISIREECSSKLQLVPLLDQFEDKLRHMGNVVTLSDRSGDQSDITQIYRHKLDEIDIPKEFWITLHTTRSQDLFQSKAAEVIKGEAEENTIQVEDEYIKKFNDQYEQYINTIIGIEESWPAVVDSYERIFDGDVKKVVNLYKLKYDETN